MINVGGHRFETTLETLRRVPDTYLSAYFGGRYRQDVCTDGSIFIDRDGRLFEHVLTYLRDGVVTVAEPGVRPSIRLLRAVRREFDFFSVVPLVDKTVEQEIVLVIGGEGRRGTTVGTVEYKSRESEEWVTVASLNTTRAHFAAAAIGSVVYVIGGMNDRREHLATVEMCSFTTDEWVFMAPMPVALAHHMAVAVGGFLYVFGLDASWETVSLKFDPTTATWRRVDDMLEASLAGAAVAMMGPIVYFFGADEQEDAVVTFDTGDETCHRRPCMPHNVVGHCATTCGGLIYIIDSDAVLSYDPVSEVWSSCARLDHRREYPTAFEFGGHLHVAGGFFKNSSSTVERYDTLGDTWTKTAPELNHGRSSSCTVVMSWKEVKQHDIFESLIDEKSQADVIVDLYAYLGNDADLLADLRDKVRSKICAEVQAKVLLQFRNDMRAELEHERLEVVAGARAAVRAEEFHKVRKEVVPEVRAEIREDFDTNSTFLSDIRREEIVDIRQRCERTYCPNKCVMNLGWWQAIAPDSRYPTASQHNFCRIPCLHEKLLQRLQQFTANCPAAI